MLVSIGGAFMLFTIGLKVVIKTSDVRHALPPPLESRDEPEYVVESPKTVPFIEFSLTGHSVDATCGVKLPRLIL